MVAVANTYIYRHYQIIITENPQNRFYWTVSNPNTNDTVYHFNGDFADQTTTQNSAQAFIDLLPANACKPFIEAVAPGLSDTIIQAILEAKYTINVANHYTEFVFQENETPGFSLGIDGDFY